MRDGGDLVLGHRLGNGGAATIFAARWRGREVSAKVAHGADHDAVGDLAVEAEVLGRVSHAALLEVLATGHLVDGRPYLVLPLLSGEDLGTRLGRGALSLPHALEVIAAVGGALTALHAAGVVHRDLKPENVFLGEDGVFLLDLGLARDLAAGTASSRIRGTYDVMAPERLYGEPASIATEVYELAALAWVALTGTLPWPSGAAPSARRGIPPLMLEDGAGAALDAVLRSALSTIPERRPASVGELVAALENAARDPGPVLAERRRTEELCEVQPVPAVPPVPTVPTVPTAMMPTVGSEIAESYRLLGVLGSGGSGTVFAAEHLRLPRRLAIKILRPDRGDPDARARFRREAEIIASLSHPHIVEVFDYDVDDGGAPFMVMELLEGETLRDRLRRGRLPPAEVVDLVRQVASAVSAAHARGVVHRDLKPSNVFLRHTASGALDVRILDFGISKVLGDGNDDTTSGLALGSPGYAAPEQSRGEAQAIGPTTDVFALAAIAYEALSGRRAFGAATREGVVHRILHDDPDPLHPHGVSRAIEKVVRAGLARRPDRRPSSAQAFADTLSAAALAQGAPRRRVRIAIGTSLVATAALLLVAWSDPDGVQSPPPGAFASAPSFLPRLPGPPETPRPRSSMASIGAMGSTSSTGSMDAMGSPGSSATIAAARPAASVARPASDAPAATGARSAPRTRSVRVVARPATARVVIDGRRVTGARVELAAGPHELRATAPGYRPLTRVIDPARVGNALEIHLTREGDRTSDRKPGPTEPDPSKLPSLRDLLEK